ncbi:MAG TPA: hypothetical protein VGL65_08375 [Gemmatimonadales bacterium]
MTLAGCSLVSSDDPSIQGEWAGGEEQISASKTEVQLTSNGCFTATFQGPLRLFHGDSFAIAGAISSSSWQPEVGRKWRVSGVVKHDTLEVMNSFQILGTDQWVTPWSAMLIAGQLASPPLFCPE